MERPKRSRSDLYLVGIAEVAELAGITRQTATNWRRRSKDMPKPLANLKCGPIWDGHEIIDWLIRIGFTHLKRD